MQSKWRWEGGWSGTIFHIGLAPYEKREDYCAGTRHGWNCDSTGTHRRGRGHKHPPTVPYCGSVSPSGQIIKWSLNPFLKFVHRVSYSPALTANCHQKEARCSQESLSVHRAVWQWGRWCLWPLYRQATPNHSHACDWKITSEFSLEFRMILNFSSCTTARMAGRFEEAHQSDICRAWGKRTNGDPHTVLFYKSVQQTVK